MMNNKNKHTILIVDDDEAQVSLVDQILQQESKYNIITTTKPLEAMNLAEMYSPTIIISDYFMPGMNGFQFCKKIKEHPILREGMFLLLTAATSVEEKVQGLESGADEFISKPVHFNELIARVNACARIIQLQQDLKAKKEKLAEMNLVLEESYKGMLDLLAVLLGLHVPNAAQRAEKASQVVQWFSEKLSLEKEESQVIQSAAVLHEIGKISILSDMGETEDSSFEKKERSHYPLAGQNLLAKIPRLKEVGLVIRHQLENFDGTGTPDRLMGNEIPFGSRLLRAINFVEHLEIDVTQYDKIIEALHKARGIVLDPVIVQLFEEFLLVAGQTEWIVGKRSITVVDLVPGLKLASDLNTGSGTKLLPKETVMTEFHINRILSHHQIDPILGSIFVYQ
jgi:response regulator RpfG family c-di-GMP phosphodiesterase